MFAGCQQCLIQMNFQDIHIPLAVFDYIDNNKNPQLYTRKGIEEALTANEETRGKIDMYRKFKYNLTSELQKEFPGEINKYRAIRKDE
jgi:Transcription factor subunit Med10 of Mediator complex